MSSKNTEKNSKGYDTSRSVLYAEAATRFLAEVKEAVSARKELGIRQSEIASSLSISLRTVISFEKGMSPNGIILEAYREIILRKSEERSKIVDVSVDAVDVYNSYPSTFVNPFGVAVRLKNKKRDTVLLQELLVKHDKQVVIDVMNEYLRISDEEKLQPLKLHLFAKSLSQKLQFFGNDCEATSHE